MLPTVKLRVGLPWDTSSKGPCPTEPGSTGMLLRGHYTQVRFGPQVALQHRFSRPIHRMYSKWYKPLVVQPKFTRWGKHVLASSHLRQARTPPLDFGRRRGTVSFGPALPTGANFQGSPPPGCILASISSKATPSHWCHHHAQWEPGGTGAC